MTLALAYMLMFFFAFGTIANFGILARERQQLMPFVFVLLASRRAGRRDATSADSRHQVQPRAPAGGDDRTAAAVAAHGASDAPRPPVGRRSPTTRSLTLAADV